MSVPVEVVWELNGRAWLIFAKDADEQTNERLAAQVEAEILRLHRETGQRVQGKARLRRVGEKVENVA